MSRYQFVWWWDAWLRAPYPWRLWPKFTRTEGTHMAFLQDIYSWFLVIGPLEIRKWRKPS